MVNFVLVDPRQTSSMQVTSKGAANWPVWYAATNASTTATLIYNGTAAGNGLQTVTSNGAATTAWPISGRGAWINTTVATVGTLNGTSNGSITLLRASWVNGYLCLPLTPAAITVVPVSEQIAQIAMSPAQAAELQRELGLRAERAAIRERRRARELQRAAREWEQAVRRAKRLLLRHLDRDQKTMYAAEQRFIVKNPSGSCRYEITEGHAHNVFALDELGARVQELCVVPVDHSCPVPDIMLAQKLWIEHMEDEMVSKANVWDMQTRRLIHRGGGPQVQAA